MFKSKLFILLIVGCSLSLTAFADKPIEALKKADKAVRKALLPPAPDKVAKKLNVASPTEAAQDLNENLPAPTALPPDPLNALKAVDNQAKKDVKRGARLTEKLADKSVEAAEDSSDFLFGK